MPLTYQQLFPPPSYPSLVYPDIFQVAPPGRRWPILILSSPPTTLPQSPSRRENPAALFNSSPSFMNFSYLFLTFFLFFDKKVEGVCLVCAGFRSVEGGCMYLYVYIFFFSSSFTWRSGKQPHAVTSSIE